MDDREGDAGEIAVTARAHFATAAADFGGVYIDHTDGSTVVLAVNGLSDHEAALRRKVRDPSRLRMRPVGFSLAVLENLVRRVVADFPLLEANGAAVSGVTLFEQDNVIEVALRNDTEDDRRVLENRYPKAALRITGPLVNTGDGVDGLNAPPLKGGQSITASAGPNTLSLCTSGFVTYRQTRTDAAIWVTDYFLATAGHCDEGQRRFWKQGPSTSTAGFGIGLSERNRYVDNSSADAMRIPMSFNDRSQYVAITSTNNRIIINRQGQNADVVNETVCVSGAKTGGERCGLLVSKNFTRSPNPTILYQRLATYYSQGGDSGGSVLASSTAKGVHSGRTAFADGRNYARYSHIFEVLLQLDLSNVYGV